VAFMFVALGLPLVVMLIAALIREYHRAPQSAASEFPALLIILDGTMAVDAKHFSDRIATHDVSADLVWIGVLCLLLCASLWQFCLNVVEPAILTAHRAGVRGTFPFKTWLFAWTSAMILLVAHVALLTGRVL
jgi:hypothetical protein